MLLIGLVSHVPAWQGGHWQGQALAGREGNAEARVAVAVLSGGVQSPAFAVQLKLIQGFTDSEASW